MADAQRIAAEMHSDTRDLLLQCAPNWFVAADLRWSRAIGATGSALMRLSGRGLLQRATDDVDRRRSRYRLTPLGLEVRTILVALTERKAPAESTPSPDTEGVRLAKEFARHCANADEQVGHGNMARLRMEFDTFVWDKRHAIAALLRTAQNTGRDEVLEAFAGHRNWELSYEYGEEEPGAWQVHSVNGGINDRQWTFIGSGETPSEAITAALSSPPVSTVDEEGGGA